MPKHRKRTSKKMKPSSMELVFCVTWLFCWDSEETFPIEAQGKFFIKEWYTEAGWNRVLWKTELGSV